MIELSFSQIIAGVVFVGGSYGGLLIHIYKNQTKRIATIEMEQKACPVNKIYTIMEKVKTDICWIKKAIQKKT